MALDDRDPLERAVEEVLRRPAVPADVWARIRDRVRSGVRASVGPGEPVRVLGGPDADDGSATWVSSRVLVTLLRGALGGSADYAPSEIELRLDGDRLERLVVGLVAAYGADLAEVVDHARRAVREVALELLDAGAIPVDVEVLDVVEGDPRTT